MLGKHVHDFIAVHPVPKHLESVAGVSFSPMLIWGGEGGEFPRADKLLFLAVEHSGPSSVTRPGAAAARRGGPAS